MKSKPSVRRLGDLQLRILKCLWARNEATVGEVHEDLGGSAAFAYTTVATMLRKMESRSLVTHREEGRSFVYRATLAADEISGGAVNDLVDRIFEGSIASAVSHLLKTREISRDELRSLEKMIAERKKNL
jgi:predicted transcriptional regulator